MKTISLFVLLSALLSSPNAFSESNKVTLYTAALQSNPQFIKDSLLNQEWANAKASLVSLIKNSKNNSTALYVAQIRSASFLRYAIESKHDQWVLELIEVFASSYSTVTKSSEYLYSYPVLTVNGVTSVPQSKVLPLTRPFEFWVNSSGQESVLDSSQFLYPITTLLLWTAQNPKYRNHPSVARFVTVFYPLALKDHYLRWVLGRDSPLGVLQVKGWGCNIGNFNYQQHFQNLIDQRYGTSYFLQPKNIPYCNMLRDSDLFVAMGVMNLVRANQLNVSRFPLAKADAAQFDLFLKKFITLLNARTVYGTVRTPSGGSVKTINIDPTSTSKHPDYRYAGDLLPTFPGWLVAGEAPNRAPQFANNVGWDISHARRLTYLTWTLDRVGTALGVVTKTKAQEIGSSLANTLAYATFNGNLTTPSFSNYFGGVNGWYRVNYSNRSGFGYEPSSVELNRSILDGGYGFWSQYNKDLPKILFAAEKKFAYRDRLDCQEVYASMPVEFFTSSFIEDRKKRTPLVCGQ